MSARAHDRLDIVDAYWAQLRAVDDRVARRARVRVQRRRLARTLALALLALLLAAAAAVAAKVLLFGSDAPPRYPSFVEDLGTIDAGSSRLLAARESDPDGGPEWGIRAFRAGDARNVCLQPGRVVNGELVALGVAGAFGDDGDAHRLPTEATTCVPEARGHVRLMIGSDVLPRSGFVPNDGSTASSCVSRARRRAVERGPAAAATALQAARESGDATAIADAQRRVSAADRGLASAPDVCPNTDLRTVLLGFAGANARSVSFQGARHSVHPEEDGAFMFVMRGEMELGADPLVFEYPDGTSCPQPVGSPTGATAPPSAACLRQLG